MKKVTILLFCLIFTLSGCKISEKQSIMKENKDLKPEEILEASIKANMKLKNYYIEYNSKLFKNEELANENITKEWSLKTDGNLKRKIESTEVTEIETTEYEGVITSISDGDKITFYPKGAKEMEVVNSILAVEEMNRNRSIKEKILDDLDKISSMYVLEDLKEEKINEIETYHLKGNPKNKNQFMGKYEVWIDKENFMVVKMIEEGKDIIEKDVYNKFIIENTRIDLSPKIDLNSFKLKVPKEVEVVNKDNLVGTKKITVEDAYKYLNKNLLIINDENYKLKRIEGINLNIEDVSPNLTFIYTQDGREAFRLYVDRRKDEFIPKLDDEPGIEVIQIRGNKGYAFDGIASYISFQEDGNYYNLRIKYNKVSIEKALEIIKNMEQYK